MDLLDVDLDRAMEDDDKHFHNLPWRFIRGFVHTVFADNLYKVDADVTLEDGSIISWQPGTGEMLRYTEGRDHSITQEAFNQWQSLLNRCAWVDVDPVN